MANKWKTATVDEIKASGARSLAMGPFGSDITTDNFVPFGVPVIRGINLSVGRFHDTDFVFVTDEKADDLIAANAFPGDLVFTHRGTLGQVGLIPPNAQFPRYVVSQSQMKLSVDRDVIDPLFLYYFFKSPIGQYELLANTSTTGVPAISRPLSSLRAIHVPVPPLSEQRAIAHILGVLDDKIQLNHRMNETLEAMTRAVFKSWFINFDPVRAKAEGRQPDKMSTTMSALFPDEFKNSNLGPIPAGWEIKPLDEVANFLNGLALQKFPPDEAGSLPVIKIAELRRGITESSDRASAGIDARYIVHDGDVLFAWSGSLDACIWCGGTGALNQHLFKVTSDQYPKWFYYLWIREHLPEFQAIAAGKATTMGHIQRHHLTQANVLVPPSDVINEMGNVVGPLVERQIANQLESRVLRQVRDALLPQLLSGEVRVKEAKKVVEAAV